MRAAAANLDKDGDMDIIVAGYNSGDMVVLLNDGTGTFSSPQVYSVAGQTNTVAVTDINGDGHPDALITTSVGQRLSAFLNDGHGFFSLSDSINMPGSAIPVVATTLTGQGPYIGAIVGQLSTSNV